MNEALDDLLEKMPGEGASEAEIEAFMEQVMATPGGTELIRDFAEKITSGGALDTMIREDEEEAKKMTLESPARLVFRIEVLGIEPLIWRRLSLPADCAYFHLHCAIQDAFGWEDSHLHRFEVWEDGHRELIFSMGTVDEEEENDYCEIENKIADLFRENIGELLYLYDFGDNWRHRIVIEKLVEAGAEGTSLGLTPHLHEGAGHGPPENCGGPFGFSDFLAGDHSFCQKFEPEVLEEFRTGQPDLSKVTFRDPASVLRKLS